MTPEELYERAKEAWSRVRYADDPIEVMMEVLAEARAEERAACARQADLHRDRPHLGHNCLDDDCGPDIAAAIRARGAT